MVNPFLPSKVDTLKNAGKPAAGLGLGVTEGICVGLLVGVAVTLGSDVGLCDGGTVVELGVGCGDFVGCGLCDG